MRFETIPVFHDLSLAQFLPGRGIRDQERPFFFYHRNGFWIQMIAMFAGNQDDFNGNFFNDTTTTEIYTQSYELFLNNL